MTSADTDSPSVATVSASQLVKSAMELLNVATDRMKIDEFVQVGRNNTLPLGSLEMHSEGLFGL